MNHICVSELTIIGSDNGLSPGWFQAIIWTNTGILLIGTLGTNSSAVLIQMHTFSLKKIHLKMSSGDWRPFFLGLNVLTHCGLVIPYDKNKLGPHLSWLAQAIAFCLEAPSHYLNQCWLIVMRRPVPLGVLISKTPFEMELGCGQLRSVKHAQQVNSFFHSGSKVVHIYFSP